MKIINDRNYMFRKGDNFQIPKEYKYVCILGETKKNPETLKRKATQKKNYTKFCEDMNKHLKETFFVTF